MGVAVTTLLHRMRVLRGTSGAPWTHVPEAGPADLRTATATRARALLTPADRRRYDALLAAAPGTDGVVVLERTLAATWSVTAVQELADLWAGLSVSARAAVLDPVEHLGRPGRQTDRTTCGSAALAMLAAVGDPALALWLATGDVLPVACPPELSGATRAQPSALRDGPAERRFAPLQRVVKRRTSRGSLLGLPWPAALGTPPWAAAREARFAGLAFRHRILDDTDPRDLEAVLDEVAVVLDHGVPVPLFSGGDTSGGLAAAVPRHVVLAHRRTATGLAVWEPGSGAVVQLPREDLLAARGPHAALGGWTHLVWAVLPDL